MDNVLNTNEQNNKKSRFGFLNNQKKETVSHVISNNPQLTTHNFKLRYLFNISCLIRAKVVISFLIIFISLAFFIPLFFYIAQTKMAAYSWVFALINVILLLLIMIFSVHILYIENKTNSVDMFFVGKGYTKISSFLIKTFSILSVLLAIVIIQAILLVIFMAVFQFTNSIPQFFMMTFFGGIIFSCFILPIVGCFGLYSSKILFALSSFILLLLPFTSLVPRLSAIKNDPYVYNGKNLQNYVNSYDFSNDVTTSYEIQSSAPGTTFFLAAQESPVYTPFMPGEILFSPYTLTYQVNTGITSDGLGDGKFQSNINRLQFVESNSQSSGYGSNYTLLYRVLDQNIFTMTNDELNKKILTPLIDLFYEYGGEKFFMSQSWNNVVVTNPIVLILSNFMENNPSAFYMYRVYQIYNSYHNKPEEMPIRLKNFVEERLDRVISAAGEATSPYFANFLEISIAPPDVDLPDISSSTGQTITTTTNTVLSALVNANQNGVLYDTYPFGGILPQSFLAINQSDLVNFRLIIDENSYADGFVSVRYLEKNKDIDGNIVWNNATFSLNVDQAIRNSSDLFGSVSDTTETLPIHMFVNTYRDTYDGTTLANPNSWTVEIFKLWNDFMATKYLWFDQYITALKAYASQDLTSENSTKYMTSSLRSFSLTNNNNSSNLRQLDDTIYTFLASGEVKYTPFNNNLLFGIIIMVVISINCWIILFLINRRE